MHSILELFNIGIGPSSSHTVGPMKAAKAFRVAVGLCRNAGRVARIKCACYGSLGATGRGHGTDRAIIAGLLGYDAKTVDPALLQGFGNAPVRIEVSSGLILHFDPLNDLEFDGGVRLPGHSNAMRFSAVTSECEEVLSEIWYSTGGGVIVKEGEKCSDAVVAAMPYSFSSGSDLIAASDKAGLGISDLALANEAAFRSESKTREALDEIWAAMKSCVDSGCSADGFLPGGLRIRRRARKIHEALLSGGDQEAVDSLFTLDWVNLYAMAVNEENAAGGRVVTAPTNGAAGVIPSVMMYAEKFQVSPYPDGIHRFLLAAGTIGLLYKMNASISGAEVGCQGEVGVACSMAAAGLVEFCGGSARQVENAAEIGMEHNLGLTCDPVGGLVQVPCIERNAMGAVKAINAARLALAGNGHHLVTLDQVIETMMQTGRDMQEAYKETSKGGLAKNVPLC